MKKWLVVELGGADGWGILVNSGTPEVPLLRLACKCPTLAGAAELAGSLNHEPARPEMRRPRRD